jgi:hypothetical protein
MTDFIPFGQYIHRNFALLQDERDLFHVALDGNEIFEEYLRAFPEGTNPLFRERTEHDCTNCRQFVRNFGGMIAINPTSLKVRSIWESHGGSLEYPYDVVMAHMAAFIDNLAIGTLFRVSQATFSTARNIKLLENGSTEVYNHFHGVAAPKFVTKEGAAVGEFDTSVQVLTESFERLNLGAVQAVLDMIHDGVLYRGEEHRAKVRAFQAALERYVSLDPKSQQRFIAVTAPNLAVSRFKNSVIGTLVSDLADGEDIERAVRSFEAKVAPANYQRTSQIVTQKMVDDALKQIDALGLNVSRRMAHLDDISVTNVLWVNGDTAPLMKHGLSAVLAGAVKATPVTISDKAVTEIGIDAFLSEVMPQATAIRLLLAPDLANNFMTLTTADGEGGPPLFKWNNNFAWSYTGNTTDSEMRQRVQAAGGRVDGVLRFTHSWNYDARNASLMDLHVFMPGSSSHSDGIHDRYPSGQRVGWNNRNDSVSGGVQDVDYVNEAPAGYIPVENITFPDMGRLKDGTYTFKIHNWQLRSPNKGGFRAEIEFGGQLFQYEQREPLKHKEWVTVAVATLKNGEFTIEHHLPTAVSSQDKWGLQINQFAEVRAITLSPNYWDDNAVGNKHWFFLLKDAKTDEQPRGIYNEYLNSDLAKHRKVFDVIGERTKPAITDDQLSGIGVSSTIRKEVILEVTTPGRKRNYKIQF